MQVKLAYKEQLTHILHQVKLHNDWIWRVIKKKKLKNRLHRGIKISGNPVMFIVAHKIIRKKKHTFRTEQQLARNKLVNNNNTNFFK